MEYRKLISFGKNSFVVSLPKPWVRQHKLQKGDLIYIEENGPNLALSKKEFDGDSEEREETIIIDGKNSDWIERRVCSAYIKNCNKITLKGNEIKGKVKELQKIIQNLIALEVMEQTSDTIVAKVFLNMDTVSVEELIRKMDIVTRTMIKETCEIFKDDNYDSLNERDMDVNRLYFLVYRAVLYNFENPMKAIKNFKLSPIQSMRFHKLAFYVEGIADEARRVARYVRLLKPSEQQQKVIEKILTDLYEYYVNTMKSAHTNDHTLALQIADLKGDFYTRIETLKPKIGESVEMHKVMNRLQRMTSLIHNMGRIVYTLGVTIE
ncbi:hypothetical protein COV17_04240 [Candidatus Woesearchaeota archaeon CG10_big_fil_rev_8_21_14_0_10_36_11]|nr:MAG: hypothetical protein COV17_04240 [Candidatus Woesearchaeota archaeon CG10_big_fil_rev_8_21_14_0_10_36_11]